MFDRFMKNYGIFCIYTAVICAVFMFGWWCGSSSTERIYQEHPTRETAVQSKAVELPTEEQQDDAAEQTEEQPEEITVTATAYCACKKCCGVWAENRPNGIVYTASGTVATVGRTIAVDPDVFPIGTVLEIDGIEYVAEDTGSAVKGYKIDIYVADHDTAMDFGVRELTAVVKDGAAK